MIRSQKDPIALMNFPGSNCSYDCHFAFKNLWNIKLQDVFSCDRVLAGDIRGLIIPGGFSYGDYLRGGALASWTPIINELQGFIKKGGKVLGICNGFQILLEGKFLPGALLKNTSNRFICEDSFLEVSTGPSLYQRLLETKISLPIAHGEGRFFIDKDGLKNLEDNNQIVFRYQEEKNPNGSISNIAGICSKDGHILGMMPHPERAISPFSGGSGTAGKPVLETFLSMCL